MHPNDTHAELPGSLVEVTFNLTCNLFKRGNVYDTNFFADIDRVIILAHAGYAAALTQKRTEADDKGEGTSRSAGDASNKRGRDDDGDDVSPLPKIARLD